MDEKIAIQQIVNDSIRKKNNKKETREQNCWHVSGIGSCMRGQYLQRLGNKPDQEIDDRTLRVFDIGNKLEDWMVNLLKESKELEEGIIKIETQVKVQSSELDLRGRADLVIEKQDLKRVYEIKSKHSKAFWYMDKKGQGAQREHEYQIWTYMYLLGIEQGSIVYISKDDLAILEYPVLLNNEQLKKEVLNYLEQLNYCWENKIMPPLIDAKSWQARYCRYHQQCLNYEKVGIK